jgi:hypothetical protein
VSCEMITYQSRVIKERCLIEVIMVICQWWKVSFW